MHVVQKKHFFKKIVKKCFLDSGKGWCIMNTFLHGVVTIIIYSCRRSRFFPFVVLLNSSKQKIASRNRKWRDLWCQKMERKTEAVIKSGRVKRKTMTKKIYPYKVCIENAGDMLQIRKHSLRYLNQRFKIYIYMRLRSLRFLSVCLRISNKY